MRVVEFDKTRGSSLHRVMRGIGITAGVLTPGALHL